MDIISICTLLGIPAEYVGLVIGLLFFAYALLEFWIGKNEKIKANSLIQAIYNFIKSLLPKGGGPFIKTLIVFALVFSVGCAGTQSVAPYEIGKVTAETILYEARVMQNEGKITDTDFAKVKKAYDTMAATQALAIDFRIAYLQNRDAANKVQYEAYLRNIPLLLKDLLDIGAALGVPLGGVK